MQIYTDLSEALIQPNQVQFLDLSDQNLIKIPDDIFQLTNLTKLYLSNNQISVIPDDIAQLVSLEVLNLEKNEISVIPEIVFQLTNLKTINLGRNKIKVISPDIAQLINLKSFGCAHNQIKAIPIEIGQLTELRILSLSYNQIEEISDQFKQLIHLKELHLGNNQIEEIPRSIGRLSNLWSLILEFNLISSLPAEIADLTNLTSLNLKNNNLTSLPNQMNQLSRLTSLNLHDNRFLKFPKIITQLSNLQELHLDDNNLRSLPSSIKNLNKLEQLWLGGNSIKELPVGLGQLKSLTQLHLGRNRLHQIPSELGNLENLVSLNLSDNHLTNIPSKILELKRLKTLNLKGNSRRGTVTDFSRKLTFRQQIEKKLEFEQRERELAEKENQVKSQFLSQMSHEIRTPINGVIGSLNLIDQKKLDVEDWEHLQRAKSSGQHLLTVINEILQFSALDQGQVSYQQQPFDLINTCQQVLQIVQPLSLQKNLDLNLDYPFAISSDWVGDQQKIKQVLVNLLGNAIKFTTEGEINLKLRPISTGIRIEVTDTGIGISEEQKETIFESFTQVSQGTNRRFSGTGLGLTISQQFVQRMGGRIGVESQLGQGSIFWLELPWKRAELEEPKVRETTGKIVASTDYTGRRVMVVDDELVNREIVGAYLKKWGFEVDQAVDGRDCLRQFEAGKYDLIVMDLQMPELDGFEASQEVRKLEQEVNHARVSILALSASVMGEVWKKCESAGMNGYLSKPFETEELQQKVKQILTELDTDIDQIKSGKVEGNN